VHHRHVLDGKLLLEEFDHPRDGPRPRAHTIDGLDLAVGDEQQRLEVEHRADHRLSAGEPPSHLEVAQRVEQRKDTGLRDTLAYRRDGVVETCALRGDAAQKRDRHRHRLAVEDPHIESLHRRRADTRGLGGGGQLGADVDRDAAVVILGQPPVDLGELTGRRR
jgi:hypothetical protein